MVGIMARCEFVRTRPISLIAALLLIVLSLGVGGSASADPGNGNGNGNGAENSARAQQDKGSGVATSKVSGKSATASAKSTASSGSSKIKSGVAGNHSTSGTARTSGDVTEPQPLSNADNNSGGANGQCPGGAYCSTRDGSPSLNGNGGGNATGKPCAGCVGKADNKNPQGQRPDGSDHNNGYECDGNNGIAKGNPAHTSCTPSTPVCVVTATETCAPPVCVRSGDGDLCAAEMREVGDRDVRTDGHQATAADSSRRAARADAKRRTAQAARGSSACYGCV